MLLPLVVSHLVYLRQQKTGGKNLQYLRLLSRLPSQYQRLLQQLDHPRPTPGERSRMFSPFPRENTGTVILDNHVRYAFNLFNNQGANQVPEMPH
jgi:hypothetical protein